MPALDETDVEANQLRTETSMGYIQGVIEEGQQNAIKAAIDEADRSGKGVDIERAYTVGYEQAGRRLGETMSRDNEHGRLIQELKKGVRPTTMVQMRDGSLFDCRTIGNSRSHRVQTNRLTGGQSVDDPLLVDRTPPVKLFPYGTAAEEISPVFLDERFVGTSSASSSSVLPTAAPKQSITSSASDVVDRVMDRTMN